MKMPFKGCVDTSPLMVCDSLDPSFDFDGDGIANHLDIDSDNDGITDLVECFAHKRDAESRRSLDNLMMLMEMAYLPWLIVTIKTLIILVAQTVMMMMTVFSICMI